MKSFKRGDRVHIVGPTSLNCDVHDDDIFDQDHHRHVHCNNSWTDGMDKHIGTKDVIVDINVHGLTLRNSEWGWMPEWVVRVSNVKKIHDPTYGVLG